MTWSIAGAIVMVAAIGLWRYWGRVCAFGARLRGVPGRIERDVEEAKSGWRQIPK